MRSKLVWIVLFSIISFTTVKAQDSNATNQKETKEERKARVRAEGHPNALTEEQRKKIKEAEDFATYQKKNISFDPNLTPSQRREKILESKKQMMQTIKSILTPQQLAKIEVRKSKHVDETPAVAVINTPKGPIKYEDREKTFIKTLDVTGDSVKIEFYDNGAIDGDSISVFYNGRLIVQHLMLLATPAAFMIPIDRNNPKNEIVMYAENLGTEPPNTALLVVTDGKKHYEVDVSSDLKKSGTIFLHPVPLK